ncbi:MAG: hypothetical protein ACLUIQ_05885 [Dialister invisus]
MLFLIAGFDAVLLVMREEYEYKRARYMRRGVDGYIMGDLMNEFMKKKAISMLRMELIITLIYIGAWGFGDNGNC